jgi:hypothetical protein
MQEYNRKKKEDEEILKWTANMTPLGMIEFFDGVLYNPSSRGILINKGVFSMQEYNRKKKEDEEILKWTANMTPSGMLELYNGDPWGYFNNKVGSMQNSCLELRGKAYA